MPIGDIITSVTGAASKIGEGKRIAAQGRADALNSLLANKNNATLTQASAQQDAQKRKTYYIIGGVAIALVLIIGVVVIVIMKRNKDEVERLIEIARKTGSRLKLLDYIKVKNNGCQVTIIFLKIPAIKKQFGSLFY